MTVLVSIKQLREMEMLDQGDKMPRSDDFFYVMHNIYGRSCQGWSVLQIAEEVEEVERMKGRIYDQIGKKGSRIVRDKLEQTI